MSASVRIRPASLYQKRGSITVKHFIDGDQVVVTKDDFIDLQESPVVFVPCKSETGQAIRVGVLVTWRLVISMPYKIC